MPRTPAHSTKTSSLRVRDMAAEILRMAGYNVLEARDGMEALGVVARVKELLMNEEKEGA